VCYTLRTIKVHDQTRIYLALFVEANEVTQNGRVCVGVYIISSNWFRIQDLIQLETGMF
jgi:hypothetical protein